MKSSKLPTTVPFQGKPISPAVDVRGYRRFGLPWLAPLLLGILVFVRAAGAAAPEVPRRPPPAWIEPVSADLSAAKALDELDAGRNRLLIEQQINVAEETRYTHFATRFLTGKAVEEGARISITFDPSYEALTMHQLVVHRDGKSIDRLAQQEIKVLQREARLDRQLYDGRLSAEIILEDIRVGDVLEYAYSIHGQNPIFGGHYEYSFYTNRNETVHHLRLRLLWPAGRQLQIKDFGEKLEPTRTRHGSVTEYVWERKEVPAAISDGEVPSWYETWGWIQLSEFDSWGAVAQWANGIYVVPGTIPDELEKELRKIAPLEAEESRVLAALRYVQDNIRYLGIEVGVNSHKPYPIEKILARRFGDCKDKALLLCTMLRHLGFQAWPALVGTETRQSVSDWLPSPAAFDHLVVQLSLHGKVFWLDPTARDQGGSLERIFFPAYGHALVIAPGTTALTAVQPSGFTETSCEVVESFDFQDLEGTATLRVRTTWRGNEADGMRSYLADTSREEVQKNDLNDYARLYPQVATIELPRFRDDRVKNVIVEDEIFHLSGFWTAAEKEKDRLRGTFTSQIMRELAKRPTTRVRATPFALRHPKRAVHVMEMNMPWGVTWEGEHTTIENPAFGFAYSAVPSGARLTLRYMYESRRDHVPPSEMGQYLADIERMHEHLSYQISTPNNTAAAGAASASPAPTRASGKPASVVEIADAAQPGAAGLWMALAAVVIVAGGIWRWAASRRVTPTGPPALHRCAVCGETEESSPALDFRVAANGQDYCQRHLPSRTTSA